MFQISEGRLLLESADSHAGFRLSGNTSGSVPARPATSVVIKGFLYYSRGPNSAAQFWIDLSYANETGADSRFFCRNPKTEKR